MNRKNSVRIRLDPCVGVVGTLRPCCGRAPPGPLPKRAAALGHPGDDVHYHQRAGKQCHRLATGADGAELKE